MTPAVRTRVVSLVLFHAALVSGPLHAALFWVGSEAGCTHSTLQAAINAAQANGPGADEIRVRTGTFLNQNLSIEDHSLSISGGWNACGAAAQQTARSVLSAGASAGTYGSNPVLRIRMLAGPQSVSLRNLLIQDGYGQAVDGGGIHIYGRASVVLENVQVDHNYTFSIGGGIYINGSGSTAPATVELHRNVTISNNRAEFTGGGIYGRHANIRIRADLTDIVGNLAGFGGGIGVEQATITVGAVGQPVPYQNATGAKIRNNRAVQGGGVWLINHATLDARELSLEGNIATAGNSSGGGIYADSNAFVRMARDYPDANVVSCPADQNCSRIVGNRAGNGCPGTNGHGGGAYFDGANGFFYQTMFLENCAYGSPALNTCGAMLVLEGVVVAKNRLASRGSDQTGRRVVSHASRSGNPISFSDIRFSTFADNVEVQSDGSVSPAMAVQLINDSSWSHELVASAFAEPVSVSGSFDAYGPCNRIQLQSGNFVNPAANDYRPTLAGFLVDACSEASISHFIQYTDPRKVARCQDHSRPDQGGKCDVGAYELPTDIPADRIFAHGFEN